MSDRLRVLFVPHAYAPVMGGTELLCRRLAETLLSEGHDVRVVTTDAGSIESYYSFGIPPVRRIGSRVNGVEITTLRLGGRTYDRLGPIVSVLPALIRDRLDARVRQFIRWRLVERLRREVEAFRPDVVVTLPHLVVNVQAVLTIHRKRPFPLVMLPLLHEEDPQWSIAAMRDALGQADAVVAITGFERERLIGAYGVRPEAVFVGGMGVDMHEELPAPPTVRNSVVFLGRKSSYKDVPLLVDAMPKVWQVRPEVRLVLAGARSKDTAVIEARIQALPPAFRGNVVSEDDISEARKVEILASAACLVLPSRVESFGGVILEAWAQTIPVITLDLPVFREIVDRDVNGLLVPPGDVEGLSGAILWMLDHPEPARAMGEAGFSKARGHYTWPAITSRHLDACRFAVRAFRSRHEPA